MFSTTGIEAIATITELRSKSSALIEQSKDFRGIMIQKNNEPIAVLLSYDRYLELIGEKRKK